VSSHGEEDLVDLPPGAPLVISFSAPVDCAGCRGLKDAIEMIYVAAAVAGFTSVLENTHYAGLHLPSCSD
jgi:hypothetical protein